MDVPDRLPIWKPEKPSHFGERHFAYSPKLRRYVSLSSKLEFERMLLLERDPDVLAYCEQPECAEVRLHGWVRRSRFDFWVATKSYGARFEEVKYASELRDPHSRAHRQIEIQQFYCRLMGYQHEVVTDEHIWANPVLIGSMRTLIYEYDGTFPARVHIAEQDFPTIEIEVTGSPGMTIAELMQRRPLRTPPEVFRLAIIEMIRRRILEASIESVPLSPNSRVRLLP